MIRKGYFTNRLSGFIFLLKFDEFYRLGFHFYGSVGRTCEKERA